MFKRIVVIFLFATIFTSVSAKNSDEGLRALYRGDKGQAFTLFAQSLQQNPNDPEAVWQFSWEAKSDSMEQFQKGGYHAAQLAMQQNDPALSHYFLAQIHRVNERYDDALDEFDKAIAADLHRSDT